MSTPYTDREVLEIFVESVDELLGSNFASQIQKGVATAIVLRPKGIMTIAKSGPDKESLRAFLLTLRRFRQNNDPTSLSNMDVRIQQLNIPSQLKTGFQTSRGQFNSYLDGAPNTRFPGIGADTRRDIFEALLYGIYAHADPIHRRKVKSWEALPCYADIEAEFDLISQQFLNHLSAMAAFVREILKRNI